MFRHLAIEATELSDTVSAIMKSLLTEVSLQWLVCDNPDDIGVLQFHILILWRVGLGSPPAIIFTRPVISTLAQPRCSVAC